MAYLCLPRYSACSPADRAGRALGTAAASQPIRARKRGRPPRSPAASSGPEGRDVLLNGRPSTCSRDHRLLTPEADVAARIEVRRTRSRRSRRQTACWHAAFGCGQAPGPMRMARLRMLRSGRPSAACPRCGVDPAPHSQDLPDGHAPTELALLRATAMPAESTPSRAKSAIWPLALSRSLYAPLQLPAGGGSAGGAWGE